MTDERIDIEVQDKISAGPANKLRDIARAALEADGNIRRMVASMASVNTSAFDRMATASAKVTRAAAQQTSAEAQLTNATARMTAAVDKSAIANQRLATEAAKTAAAQAKQAAASSQATTAANNAARSQLSLAAAQARANTATNAAGAAQSKANNLYTQGNRISRQSRQQLLNLTYQLNDVVVGLASGQKPLTVLLQQGSQISTIFGGGLGVVGTLKALGSALSTLIPPPVLAAIAAAAVGLGVLTNEIRKATGVKVSIGDTFFAVFQVLGKSIADVIKQVPGVTTAFSIMYDGLVAIMKQVVIVITAPFSFAYNQIITVFKNLAPALGEIFVAAFNGVLIIVETAINGIIAGINKINTPLNAISKKLGGLGNIQLIDPVQLGRVSTDFKALSGLVSETGDNLAGAMDPKRVEGFFNEIAKQAVKNKAARDKEKNGRKETFADIVQQYEYEIAGLKKVGLERERILAIGKAEDKLNRDLTDTEKKRLSGLVDMLKTLEMVNEINQPLINLRAQLPLLDKAFAEGLISADQYRQKILELNLEAAKLDRSFSGGLRQGLIQVEQQFGDISQLVSSGVVNAFQSAEDALTEFVSKGTFNFKGFVDSLIADLARLYVRMQIIGPLAKFLGLTSFAAGAPGAPVASYAVGTDRVPHDMIAKIHKDEIIVPASQSRAIRAGKASLGASGGNSNIITFAPTIQLTMQGGGSQANQQQQAQAAAKLINDEVEKKFMELNRREMKQGGLYNRQNTVA